MEIKRIQITGLFGMFTHDIPLNTAEGINIIYGVNGTGKTMLFKIINHLYQRAFHALADSPFEELRLFYGNDAVLSLRRSSAEEYKIIRLSYRGENPQAEAGLSLFDSNEAVGAIDIVIDLKELRRRNHRIVRRRLPFEQLGFDEFAAPHSDEVIKLDDIISRFPDYFEIDENEELPFLKQGSREAYDFTTQVLKHTNVHFIPTQRLISFRDRGSTLSSRHSLFDTRFSVKIDTVEQYAEDLKKKIREVQYKYSQMSESLDSSLGKRLLNKEVQPFPNIEDLREENKRLEAKREDLRAVGLFEEEGSLLSSPLDELDDTSRAILSVNIQDAERKLQIFDDLYEKLNIFLKILNTRRFSHKKISINPRQGFVFRNTAGNELKVTELSSGEQHEIVMLYELLFKVSEQALVLIDEPEISLHILWQKAFLSDIKEIIRIRKIHVLIATHSPAIINGNWDLTLELGKSNEYAS